MKEKFNTKRITLSALFLFTFYLIKAGVPFEKVAHDLTTLETFNKLNSGSHYSLLQIQGKVEKMCIFYYGGVVEKFGEIIEDQSRIKKGCFEFDINGKIIKITKQDKVTLVYLYDSGGKLIEMTEKNEVTPNKKLFYYNEHKLLIKQDEFRGDNLSERFIYKYDNNNNPIELNRYDSNGELVCYFKNRFINNTLVEEEENWFEKSISTRSEIKKYKYNSEGVKSHFEIISNSNDLNQKIKSYSHIICKLNYDFNGNQISSSDIYKSEKIWDDFNSSPCSYNDYKNQNGFFYNKNKNGKCTELYESESISNYKYDLKNNLIEVDASSGRRQYYKYDSNNRKVSYKDFDNKVLKREFYYTYNNQGFILTEEEDDCNNCAIESKKKYEYSYESNGNIISKKSYRNGKIVSLEKNSYVY